MKAKRPFTMKDGDLSASLEDYLEAIFNIARRSKVARSKDIAQTLGVSRASVTGALRMLKDKGLANYKPYGYVTLTETGQAAAAEVVRKHDILASFFIKILGVEPDTAQKAACKAEHALGPNIISRLLCFSEFASESNKNGFNLANEFQRFCRKKDAKGKRRRVR
jgi:DtxR family Mn-dependent transcriptional regulator